MKNVAATKAGCLCAHHVYESSILSCIMCLLKNLGDSVIVVAILDCFCFTIHKFLTLSQQQDLHGTMLKAALKESHESSDPQQSFGEFLATCDVKANDAFPTFGSIGTFDEVRKFLAAGQEAAIVASDSSSSKKRIVSLRKRDRTPTPERSTHERPPDSATFYEVPFVLARSLLNVPSGMIQVDINDDVATTAAEASPLHQPKQSHVACHQEIILRFPRDALNASWKGSKASHSWTIATVSTIVPINPRISPTGSTDRSSKLVFGSAAYMDLVLRRQLAHLLSQCSKTGFTQQFVDVDLASMRAQFPALTFIGDKFLKQVMSKISAGSGKRIALQGNDGCLRAETSIMGMSCATGSLLSPAELTALLECESVILERADVDARGAFSWTLPQLHASIQSLLSNPLFIQSIASFEVCKMLVRGVLVCCSKLEMFRCVTQSSRRVDALLDSLALLLLRHGDDSGTQSSALKRELLLLLAVAKGEQPPPHLGLFDSSMTQKQALDTLTSYVATSVEGTTSINTENEDYAAGSGLGDDMLRDLFDGPEKPPLSAQAVLPSEIPQNCICIRRCRSTGEAVFLDDPADVAAAWNTCTSQGVLAVASGPCPHCGSAFHRELFDCPSYIAHAFKLRSLKLPATVTAEHHHQSASLDEEDSCDLILDGVATAAQLAERNRPDETVKGVVAANRQATTGRKQKRRVSIWSEIVNSSVSFKNKRDADRLIADLPDKVRAVLDSNPSISVADCCNVVSKCVAELITSADENNVRHAILSCVKEPKIARELEDLFSEH